MLHVRSANAEPQPHPNQCPCLNTQTLPLTLFPQTPRQLTQAAPQLASCSSAVAKMQKMALSQLCHYAGRIAQLELRHGSWEVLRIRDPRAPLQKHLSCLTAHTGQPNSDPPQQWFLYPACKHHRGCSLGNASHRSYIPPTAARCTSLSRLHTVGMILLRGLQEPGSLTTLEYGGNTKKQGIRRLELR